MTDRLTALNPIASLSQALRRALERLATAILARDQDGARLRLLIVSGMVAAVWLAAALIMDFPRVLPEAFLAILPFPINILTDLATSLFHPQVLVHIVALLAALWLGLRGGALYLADLFELEDSSIAFRYLMGALFGLAYDHLEINHEALERLNQSSPLLRIGGPGYITVHLGFAAVFEAAEGRPCIKIFGPSERQFIEGFDRLREVVDLRDQLITVGEIRALTRDGYVVYARDAQMLLRVHSGGRSRSLRDPYPFDPAAVRRLVYGQAVSQGGARRWSQGLGQIVADEIARFVREHTIEEFLAMPPASYLEGRDQQQDHRKAFHLSREELTRRFHTEASRARLRRRGLEMDWVGVGTWEVRDPPSPAQGPGMGNAIVGTWRALQRARQTRDPDYLPLQSALASQQAVERVLQSLVEAWRQARCHSLLAEFDEQLKEMRRALVLDDLELPPYFERALEHIGNSRIEDYP